MRLEHNWGIAGRAWGIAGRSWDVLSGAEDRRFLLTGESRKKKKHDCNLYVDGHFF